MFLQSRPPKMQNRPEKIQNRPKKLQSRQKKKVAKRKVRFEFASSVSSPSEKGEFWGWSMVDAIPGLKLSKKSRITRPNRVHDLAKSRYQFWPNRVINFDQNVVKTNEEQRF